MRAATPQGTLGYKIRFIGVAMGIGESVTVRAAIPKGTLGYRNRFIGIVHRNSHGNRRIGNFEGGNPPGHTGLEE